MNGLFNAIRRRMRLIALATIPVGLVHPVPVMAGSLPASTEWSVESTDASGLTLVWHNPFPGNNIEKHEFSAAIAIAPGTLALARLKALDGQTSGFTGILQVSTPSRYRDAMVVALTWIPAPLPGQSRLPDMARMRIEFQPAKATPFRSTFAPALDDPAEKILMGWLVNYPQSRNLRSLPNKPLGKSTAAATSLSNAPPPGAPLAGPSPGAGLAKERLVIKTQDENIEVLDYASLLKTGMPLGNIDPRNMQLFFNGLEMPIFIHGENDGKWNPGDYLEFIGKRAKGETSYNSLYDATAAFILTWDSGSQGLRASEVPVPSQNGGATPLPGLLENQARPFTAHVHLELDLEVLRIGSTSVDEIVDLGSRVQASDLTDFWVWKRLGTDKDATELGFGLDYNPFAQAAGTGSTAADVRGGGSRYLQVTVNLKGITNNPKADPDHHLKFILNGSDISLVGGVNHDAVWEGQESFTWVSQPVNPAILKPGPNQLSIQKVNDLKTTDGQLVEVQDAYVNFIELDFPATYKIQGPRLRFSNEFSDSLGSKLFSLSGFTSPDLSIWDLQGRKLSNFRVTRNDGSYTADFLDTLAGPTHYMACAIADREVPSASYDKLPDLVNPSKGADYIVITQDYLMGSALDSLVEFRRKQGLRCAIVMASHIYQAFGDGSLDPKAIRRFVAWAYENWPRPAPLYLNLVGDATFWFAKRNDGQQLTTVPTHVVNIRGWGVAANDDFYAKVSGDDDIADLLVGRIPVSTKEELGNVVHKTLLLETSRSDGHWRNKTLLISGFESSFMNQNYALQAIAAGNDRQISRVDLFPGSPYYESESRRGNFFDQIDSSFNLVNFIGHGGGAVWSDASVLTLKALDENKIKGEFPIPLVSSITCLTGYFEDVSARSLGEELLRLPQGGAAGFYGASGYISNFAGETLSSEVLKAATGNPLGSIGAIVTQAETMVKLRTGDAFLPILAEFNLLGDPALRISFPEREGRLDLAPQTLAGATTLQAKGTELAMQEADAMATIYLNDSTASNTDLKVAGGKFTLDHNLAGPLPVIQNGKVVVNYWTDKEARVVSAPFSTLDWLIDSIAIEPADAAPGDSVSISLRLNTSYANTRFGTGIVSYAIGGADAPLFPGANQKILRTSDGKHLQSEGKVVLDLPEAGLAQPTLYLAFRLNLDVMNDKEEVVQSLDNISSRTYSLPLSNLAALELTPRGIHVPIQERLGVWVLFHNKGLGTAEGFRITLVQNTEGGTPVEDTAEYPGKSPFGALDSVFFPLADSMLQGKKLRASLIASRPGELASEGNAQDTLFRLQTKKLDSQEDTLALDTNGTSVRLGPDASTQRVFVQTMTLTALPDYLSPASGSLPMEAFLIESTVPSAGGFHLKGPMVGTPLPKSSAMTQPYWHFRPVDGQAWLKLDSTAESGDKPLRSALGTGNGIYALLNNRDFAAPIIQISSRGQALLPDDFVPLNTPIDVTIRDGQGIDRLQHPPSLVSHEQNLDTLDQVISGQDPFPTLTRISFLPQHNADTDSLVIIATDISGNVNRRSLLYRLGDDLAIRDLGSYPNPFADTATFVFSLTDYCDKVEVKVYSRAGRLVRSINLRNVVGYQEVQWDGRTQDKKEIANGLYFLKVTAKAGSKERSRTFKLFKKLRK